jgi:hypothetical protein
VIHPRKVAAAFLTQPSYDAASITVNALDFAARSAPVTTGLGGAPIAARSFSAANIRES